MKIETFRLNANRVATLTCYLLDEARQLKTGARPAVLVFPGGGYRFISEREAEPVAMVFLAAGYHAFVLRYSVGDGVEFSAPMSEAEAALDLMRENALGWKLNPRKIAVCGFSAGGHLAAALGTMGRVRPNALILGYPLIFDLIGQGRAFPVLPVHEKVDDRTSPTFLFATSNDPRVPVTNALTFATALDKAGVPFALHVFQDGVHGLSLAKKHTANGNEKLANRAVAVWVDLCLRWLEHQFDAASDEQSPTS